MTLDSRRNSATLCWARVTPCPWESGTRHSAANRGVSNESWSWCRLNIQPMRLAMTKPPTMRPTRMPSSQPKAWWVVMIVIGLMMGAASRNVIDSETVKPLTMSPRARGTLPHSHTGRKTPMKEMTARRRNGLRGSTRMIHESGTHTCTAIDSTMPSTTKGIDSTMTLMLRVRKSCARSGRARASWSAVTARSTNSATIPTTPIDSQVYWRRRVRVTRSSRWG
jgi:hypothetical protein